MNIPQTAPTKREIMWSIAEGKTSMDERDSEFEEMRKAIDLALQIGFKLQAIVEQAHAVTEELLAWHEKNEDDKHFPLNAVRDLNEMTKPVNMRTEGR